MGWDVAPTASAQLGDLQFQMGQIADESVGNLPQPQYGFIVGGYNPSDATVEAIFGDTYAIISDGGPDDDSLINYQRLGILTTHPGDMYGPTGAERVLLIPTPDGYAVMFRVGEDDSSNVPAGERWILHKNVASQAPTTTPQQNVVFDGGAQLTNDGTNSGDGLGGSHFGYMGDYTVVKTAQQYQTAHSDTNQTIVTTTPGAGGNTGLTSIWSDVTQSILHGVIPIGGGTPTLMTVVDGLGTLSGVPNSISHLVPTGGLVALGSLAGNLPTTTAAMNQDIMNDATSGYKFLQSRFQLNNLVQYYGALHTALTAGGLPNPSAFLSSMVSQIVLGFITPIEDVTGSSVVRLATSL